MKKPKTKAQTIALCDRQAKKLRELREQLSNGEATIDQLHKQVQEDLRLRQQLTAATDMVNYLNRVINWICDRQGNAPVTPGARVRSRKTGLFGLVQRAALPEAFPLGGEWWVTWTTCAGQGERRSLAKTEDLLVLAPVTSAVEPTCPVGTLTPAWPKYTLAVHLL